VPTLLVRGTGLPTPVDLSGPALYVGAPFTADSYAGALPGDAVLPDLSVAAPTQAWLRQQGAGGCRPVSEFVLTAQMPAEGNATSADDGNSNGSNSSSGGSGQGGGDGASRGFNLTELMAVPAFHLSIVSAPEALVPVLAFVRGAPPNCSALRQ
jgi:hypothetical protein